MVEQSVDLSQVCCLACGLVKSVGAFMLGERGKVSEIEVKALNSLVSYVDREAERRLVEGLGKLLPWAVFLTEEETIASSQGYWQWIIDPLDGTTNFLHDLPFFSISIALKRGEETVLGIVYEPNRDELFYAWEGGGGLYLNGRPSRVSATEDLAKALLATGFPYYDFNYTKHYLSLLADLFPSTRGLRRLGSAALDLAYVACGRFDAFFEYSLAPWDVAAGAYLVEAAGGQVSDFEGGANYLLGRTIIASNGPLIHGALSQKIQQHFEPRP